MNGPVTGSSGAHTLHVKAWGNKGSVCVTDVAITISTSLVPSNAKTVSSLEALSNWQKAHDTGTSGSSSGSMSIVSSPAMSGSSREYLTYFSNNGGERYSLSFSDDASAEHFFYDAWVYLTSSSSNVSNLEFDINQVMSNGQTVLTGVQCDAWSNTWTYTANEGSASSPRPHWVSKSNAYCNARSWSQYTWHHVQASISRDNAGWVTYHSIWLDGHEFPINASVYGAADLGWGQTINTQFQVDGYGSSGHVTAYLDDLKISMW